MGSIGTPPRAENGSANPNPATAACDGDRKPQSVDGYHASSNERTLESDVSKKRKSSILPLEVGTRVMCRWRDSKYHPVKVIERRRTHCGGPNDYEYYVHYTECKIQFLISCSILQFRVRVRVFSLFYVFLGFQFFWLAVYVDRCVQFANLVIFQLGQ